MDFDIEMGDIEMGLAKQTGGSKKSVFRSGKTIRAHFTRKNPSKRGTCTVETRGLEDSPLHRFPNINKNRRWELVEQLKEDEGVIVLEGKRATGRHCKALLEQFDKGSADSEPLTEEEQFHQKYRMTKGGPFRGGVMISQRRNPGKKGVHTPSAPPSPPTAVLIVEPDPSRVMDFTRETGEGTGYCKCDYCYPTPPTRAEKRRLLLGT